MNPRVSAKLFRASLCLLLVAGQLSIVGCGGSPFAPKTLVKKNRDGAIRGTPQEAPAEDGNEEGGGGPNFSAPANWYGGRNTLPVGPAITWSQALAHTDSLEAVQLAKAAFVDRGYIHHAEHDTATVGATGAVVFLSYEKPGIDIRQVMPIIFVVTRRVDGMAWAIVGDPNNPNQTHTQLVPATWYETQVSAGLLGQPGADSVAFLDVPEEPALIFPVTYNEPMVTLTAEGYSAEVNAQTTAGGGWTSGVDFARSADLQYRFAYRQQDAVDAWLDYANLGWLNDQAVRNHATLMVIGSLAWWASNTCPWGLAINGTALLCTKYAIWFAAFEAAFWATRP